MRPIGWAGLLIAALFLICFIPSFASADGGISDGLPYPRTIEDDQNVSVTLDKAPERIVSIAPSNTELLFALGLDDRIVGDTEYCNYPVEAQKKEKIGGFSTVSIEKVAALNPDLVVAADGNKPDTIDRIRSLGIPVYFSDATSLNHIQKTLEHIGYLTGVSDKAKKLNNELSSRSDLVKMEGENIEKHPSVAHVIWNDPIYVSGSGTFQDELIRIAGGENAFGDKVGHSIASVEEFISRDPDLLMINAGSGMGGNESDLSDYFRTDPRLSGLSAIQQNHVMIVNTNIADRAGPRQWDLLEQIAPEIREMA
ncbi:MAG TPA: ABC transporter substrate-binding protein [Methanospirillum sp.]|nr:ABC transporter substrate-binding protein [Methanospirillum sp.]